MSIRQEFDSEYLRTRFPNIVRNGLDILSREELLFISRVLKTSDHLENFSDLSIPYIASILREEEQSQSSIHNSRRLFTIQIIIAKLEDEQGVPRGTY